MQIVVFSVGGRGDVQPYAALAQGFVRAGHQVRFLISKDFVELVDGLEVEPCVSDIDAHELLKGQDSMAMIGSGKNKLEFMRQFSRMIVPHIEKGVADQLQALQGADGVVLSSMSILCGTRGLERLGVPYVAAFPTPITPSWQQPNVLFPPPPWWLPGRGLYNRLSHTLFESITWRMLGQHYSAALQKLAPDAFGDRGHDQAHMPLLYGYSDQVSPRPSDWPARAQITGYWFLDLASNYQPSEQLQAFIDAGPPPVYVGFGSMSHREPQQTAQLISAAIEQAGLRAVVATSHSDSDFAWPEQVLALNSVPHDWLFPKLAAVVHHCGAGTTAAGLRAGVPTLAVPHMADQFFWARRLFALGVAPKPLPRSKLTIEALATALRTLVQDSVMQKQAQRLGERIRAEDGVTEAVQRALAHFESI